MNNVTQLLDAVSGGHKPAADLLPVVYDELRQLAASKLAREKPGQTLQATALVHEAYLRLTGGGLDNEPKWENRAHFFGAAAEAMRRILVERARKMKLPKAADDGLMPIIPGKTVSPDEILAVHDAMDPIDGDRAGDRQTGHAPFFRWPIAAGMFGDHGHFGPHQRGDIGNSRGRGCSKNSGVKARRRRNKFGVPLLAVCVWAAQPVAPKGIHSRIIVRQSPELSH